MKYLNAFSNKLFENKAGYAYTNTRVRVMKSKLLEKEDYDRIMKMSVNELTRFLGETDYKREIDELSTRYSGMELIENAMNKNLENSFKRIYGFAIQASHKQIELYFTKYDAFNVLTLLRGKLSNENPENIVNNFICVGKLKKEYLEKGARECKSFDEAVEYLKDTEYYRTIKEKQKDFGKMEDAVYIQMYLKMLENSETDLRKIILAEVEMKNKLNLLRAKRANYAQYENIIIPYGKKLKALLKETEKMEDKAKFTIEIKKELINKGLKLVHRFKKNIGPVAGYFIAKENEVRNLRLISRLKSAKFEESLINEQVVI
ncbi:MAG: V-type ATPase subunit [archaeon]